MFSFLYHSNSKSFSIIFLIHWRKRYSIIARFQKSIFLIKKKVISSRFKHDFLIIRFNCAIDMSFRISKVKSINQEKNIRYNDEMILLMSFEIELNVKILCSYLIVVRSYLIFFTTSIKSIFTRIEISKRSR